MSEPSGFWDKLLGFFIANKLVVALLLVLVILGGLSTAPFRWHLGGMPRDPVPVDAIPDIGENQQIVFTKWPGRSPRDVEDQVSYPLTTALLGISGVRTVRSFSMFGFSSIYVIFEEGVEFYWSRSRILEKLASLPSDTLPEGVSPALGPDATALGQVFWYTLEGRDSKGKPTGGWDLQELRTIQDWTVRFALQSVPGVSEVASVGGYVKEYQVDIDPEALQAFGIGIDEVAKAVRNANLDVGARTMEINRAEYVVRGLGFIRSAEDLEAVVVASRDHTPIRLRDLGTVGVGPAQRRGALDVAGAPAVGGVVVVRFGANPLEVIEAVKRKIEELQAGLPRRELEGGGGSQVTIVPFYDRTELINETLGTLSTALWQQLLIVVVVVLVMLRNFRSSLLVSMVLPLGVLGAFIAMRVVGVDANVMALSGIAIAIGTMVDMGIVFTESMVAELETAGPEQDRGVTLRRAAAQVAPAVLTSTLTTVAGFLPIFGLTAAEGKLFRPLAYTKTFAMLAALIIAMVVLPAVAHLILRRPKSGPPRPWKKYLQYAIEALAVLFMVVLLADDWMPAGVERGLFANRLFVALLVGSLLGAMALFLRLYRPLLAWALKHRMLVLASTTALLMSGLGAWLGVARLVSWLPSAVQETGPVRALVSAMPGLGREYMPPFNEGAFLYMPTTMAHASIGQAQEQLALMDAAIATVPEVESVVGKLGRADSPLDPAPVSMFETVVKYKSEYLRDAGGRRGTYRFDEARHDFARDEEGQLIADDDGRPFRQWRPHIKDHHDIWQEVRASAKLPGLTDAPELMPIAARIVMLQSGMRAPLGIKVRGPDLASIEAGGLLIEKLLKEVPAVRQDTVVADRIVGKPYLEIVIDREAIARHGISIKKMQDVIQVAVGGRKLTQTVEGRARYPVRVRYMRERRDSPEELGRVLIPSPLGHQIPLEQLAKVRYARGPQVIKSEDTFLTGYVVFDKQRDIAQADAVEQAQAYIKGKLERHGDAPPEVVLPEGVTYTFAGAYKNQLRSEKRLMLLLPLALATVLLLIYMQFRRIAVTLIIMSSVTFAAAGGFLLLWLYGKPWFLDVAPAGFDLASIFRVGVTNMSVAVWVGFIALVGIATDDAVVMSTYLSQRFSAAAGRPKDIAEVRSRTVEAGCRRSRACVMTTATTSLALLPVITSTGKGSDVMLPMALPVLGGMTVALMSLFLVPLLFSWVEERKWKRDETEAAPLGN